MKRLIAVILLIALTIVSKSQDLQKKPVNTDTTKPVKLFSLYPGYIITKKDDTIKGYLMLKNVISNQDKVWFYKTKETPKKDAVKYKPKDIKAYKVGPRFYESHKFWPNVPTYVTNNARGYHFILRKMDGKIKLYKWFYESTTRSEQRANIDFENPSKIKIDLSFSENDLPFVPLIKKDGEKIIFLNSGFRKNILKAVSDDKELYNKIKNKEPGYRSKSDLEKIVREYNSRHKKNMEN